MYDDLLAEVFPWYPHGDDRYRVSSHTSSDNSDIVQVFRDGDLVYEIEFHPSGGFSVAVYMPSTEYDEGGKLCEVLKAQVTADFKNVSSGTLDVVRDMFDNESLFQFIDRSIKAAIEVETADQGPAFWGADSRAALLCRSTV